MGFSLHEDGVQAAVILYSFVQLLLTLFLVVAVRAAAFPRSADIWTRLSHGGTGPQPCCRRGISGQHILYLQIFSKFSMGWWCSGSIFHLQGLYVETVVGSNPT